LRAKVDAGGAGGCAARLISYPKADMVQSPTMTPLLFSLFVVAAPDASTFCKAIRTFPGVAKAESVVKDERPTHRIIHLRDLHFVPRDVFSQDLRDQHKDISDEEIDKAYRELLDEIESVQKNQFEFMKRLGLKQIHLEGLFPRDSLIYKRMVELAKDNNELKRRVGAAGRLMLYDSKVKVTGVEDPELYSLANPVKGTQIVFDEKANEKREDAIVRQLLSNPVSVVILGGTHYLADNIRRIGDGSCELIVVTPKGYPLD
jgi:hypothetical protein